MSNLTPDNTALQAKLDKAVEALDTSIQAIDDWLSTYASDLCHPDRVIAAHERIGLSGGTLGYIADVQQKNRNTLKELSNG